MQRCVPFSGSNGPKPPAGSFASGTTRSASAAGENNSVEGTLLLIPTAAQVLLYSNGKVLKKLPTSGHFAFQVPVSQSGWYSVYVEGPPSQYLDANYAQAATNA